MSSHRAMPQSIVQLLIVVSIVLILHWAIPIYMLVVLIALILQETRGRAVAACICLGRSVCVNQMLHPFDR